MAKKEVAKKPVKAGKPAKEKKEKGVVNVQAKIRFVSFTFGATIPTQSFGNVQPHITVEAPTYEEARDFAIEKIEELYKKYAEIKPEFLGKITVVEKEVAASVPQTQEKTVEVKAETPEVAPNAPEVKAPEDSEPVKKAKKAISLAATYDAVKLIEEQIQKSVKIKPEEKPALYELTLKRAKELKNK